MKLSEIAIVLLKLIFYALSALGIYWVLLKITGHSPTDISTLRVQMNILMGGFGFGFILLVKVLSDVKNYGLKSVA